MYNIKYRCDSELCGSNIHGVSNKPRDWESIKLKYLCTLNDDVIRENEMKSYLFRYVDIGSVTFEKGIEECQEMLFKDAPSRARRIVRNGDTIISTVRTYLKAIARVTDDKDVIVSTGFAVIRPRDIDSDFLQYALKATYFLDNVTANSKGVSYPAINATDLIDFKILNTGKIEQKKIANFLNIKTAQFESIISKKEKLIEKLEEAKKSLISEVVTGKVKIEDGQLVKRQPEEMKDSGVEWLGMIPSSWSKLTLRRIAHLKQGLQIDRSKRFIEYGRNRYVYLTIKYLNSKNKSDEIEYIENPNKGVLCDKEDVLLARTGATGTVITDVEGVFHNNFFKIIYNKSLIEKHFLVYVLKESRLKATLLLKAGTTTIPDLNHDDFLDTEFVLPEVTDQRYIVKYLNKKTIQIDITINKVENQIQKLKQAKQSLISEAVTGKIDLRDWEIIEEGEVK